MPALRHHAITDVPGIRVGHWTDRRRATGCTVVTAPDGAVAGYHNPGGAPGTLDTDLLRPENRIPRVHAVLLTGGSVYGLDAAAGVRDRLRDAGIGYRMGADAPPIPIVIGAVVFDLGIGDPHAHPTAADGRRAARRARPGRVEQGAVGVGAGCTVAKLAGRDRMLKSGLGSAAVAHGSGLIVGALVALNAVGDIHHPRTGRHLAGPRDDRPGRMQRGTDLLLHKPLDQYLAEAAEARGGVAGFTDDPPADHPGRNTSLAVVATNARLDKATATRIAIMANAGLASTVRPAHTPGDGDTVFALGTGGLDLDLDAAPGLITLLGAMAARAVGDAAVAGLAAATALAGVPTPADWLARR